LTKEKAKKDHAFKKGASPKKDQVKKRRKKEKNAGYKKEKSAVGRLSQRVSAEPMLDGIQINEQSLF